MGRWLSRDPIEEHGGLNLYGFAFNDPQPRSPRRQHPEAEEATVGIGRDINTGGSSQAISLLNKVREATDTLNDMQEFVSDLMDVADAIGDGDSVDILTAGLSAIGQGFSAVLPGGRPIGSSLAAADTTV